MKFLPLLALMLGACTNPAYRVPPLHAAAARGDVPEAERLLNAGADVRLLEPTMALSPLHKAAYSGSAPMARILIARGAPVDLQAPSNGNTPLHDALYIRNGASLDFVRVLLDAGASLVIRNRAGLTAVESAQLLGQTDAVTLFAQTQSARLPPPERALMEAVRHNDLDRVRVALDAGARVDRPDEQGFTPLIWAAREGFDDIVALLLQNHADPNQNDVWMRANAGHKAAFWGRTTALTMLVKYGLELNAQGGYNGYTALHDAVSGRHYEAAQVLISAGARLDIHGDDGKTVIDIINASNDPRLVELLARR